MVISYSAPDGLSERLLKLLKQCDGVVLVDNGSPILPTLPSEVKILRNPVNLGIAKALNQGVEIAKSCGATHALLLDHDSEPSPDLVALLSATLAAEHESAIMAVPTIRYAHPEIACRWPKTSAHARFRFHFVYGRKLDVPTPVDLAIGSGMLVDIQRFEYVGGFDESLFIDLVDTEFCLRSRMHGFKILVAPGAELRHRLGEVEQRKVFGLISTYPTNHPPIRHYFISRNRIILSRRYWSLFPSWLAYEWLGATKLILKVLLFETSRFSKLRATIQGTIDGLRSTSPTCPPPNR